MYMYFLPSIGGQHKNGIGSITDAISSVSCVNSAKPISKHQKLFPVAGVFSAANGSNIQNRRSRLKIISRENHSTANLSKLIRAQKHESRAASLSFLQSSCILYSVTFSSCENILGGRIFASRDCLLCSGLLGLLGCGIVEPCSLWLLFFSSFNSHLVEHALDKILEAGEIPHPVSLLKWDFKPQLNRIMRRLSLF
ncbi:hypothetical protein POTOM_047456 [Populus tomentosa]|uniref:Uncharacterized protein n=1 Tax=Populus tomentosa TaxID=118781 RepID=A0A8X7YCL6_POPTO|nr:hypothetical protein POTOM_047456 [Populus tomentosa]